MKAVSPDTAPAGRPKETWRQVTAGLGVAAFVGLAAWAPPELSHQGAVTLGTMLLAIAFWVSEVLDLAATGMLAVTLLSLFGVLSIEEAVSGFGSPFIWLLFSTFILTAATVKSGLDRRLALSILRLARGRPPWVLFYGLVAALVFTFLVPMSSARMSMLVPIMQGVARALTPQRGSNLGKALLMGVSDVSLVAGVAVITASSTSIYAADFMTSSLGHRWTYVSWAVTLFPGAVVFALLFWAGLNLVFPLERPDPRAGIEHIEGELRKLGRLAPLEERVLLITGLMVLGWVTTSWHGLSTEIVALLGAFSLTMPGVGVLSWEEGMAGVNWGVIIMFGSSLSLAMALQETGATAYLAESLLGRVAHPSPVLAVLLIYAVMLLVRFGFSSSLGMAAASLPIGLELARVWGLDPLWALLVVLSTNALGFFLPTQAPATTLTFSMGEYTVRDCLRAGTVASLAFLLVLLGQVFFYWPLLGIRP